MSRFGALLDSKFSLDSVDEYIEAVDDIEKIFDRCESDVERIAHHAQGLVFL